MNDDTKYEYQDLLWDTLKVAYGGYNSAVDLDVLNVMEEVRYGRPAFNTDIAKKFGLSEAHVELIQYLICSAELAEYGTSPRGCWLTKEGEAFLERMKPYHDLLKA